MRRNRHRREKRQRKVQRQRRGGKRHRRGTKAEEIRGRGEDRGRGENRGRGDDRGKCTTKEAEQNPGAEKFRASTRILLGRKNKLKAEEDKKIVKRDTSA